MKTLKFWLLLSVAFLADEAQGLTRALCKRAYSCPKEGSRRGCSCCSDTYFNQRRCPGKCQFCIPPTPPTPPPPTTPPTTTPTPTTTTYRPHEERDNMIDQFFLLWPLNSEDTLPTVDEGTNELIVMNTSSVQEDNVDQGTFSFSRKGRCGKYPQAVSIESKRHAGKFWRHQEGKIKIQEEEDTDDICFNVVKAGCEDGGFALQAANIPGKFVQKCGDKIELRTKADNCGDVKNMCWANPVSEQASLAFCETNVTKTDDVYEYPQCCNHEATLEKFGECCRENITTCSNCPRARQLLYMANRGRYYMITLSMYLRKYPECCMNSLLKNERAVEKVCHDLFEMRVKRAPAACNWPCWSINYCPQKMRGSGWEVKYPQCCCHPYRKVLMKNRGIGNPGTCSCLG